ncbi:MAG: dephospho-CoA kinase [Corynebacteriales bacterium]|nr:dephospho-CoA kinase [Mycobacteriales bacterium]
MVAVGLTGGIASGKSTVSARLVALGAFLIDADQLAREVVMAGTPGFAAVVAEFGPKVVAANGQLDRQNLAARVFGDEGARQVLNSIVHPLVRQRAAELINAAPDNAVVVQDIPLLVENGLAPSFDVVVVVEAPLASRLARLAARGLTERQAMDRIAAQASDEERRAVADVVVRNDGDFEHLYDQVETLWAQLRGWGGGAA